MIKALDGGLQCLLFAGIQAQLLSHGSDAEPTSAASISNDSGKVDGQMPWTTASS